MPVTIQIRADSRYPVDRLRVKRLIDKVIQLNGLTSQILVSIAVVGARQMRELNRQYHGIDAPTDVLSFPYLDPQSSQDRGAFHLPPTEVQILGDIVVCYPMAVKDARERKVLVDDQVDFLVEHGLNHLLGKHHD